MKTVVEPPMIDAVCVGVSNSSCSSKKRAFSEALVPMSSTTAINSTICSSAVEEDYATVVNLKKKKKIKGSVSPTTSSTCTTSVEEELATNDNQDKDNQTGLTFESGALHVDSRNRLHRERPTRILAIRTALENAPNNLWARCQLLDDSNDTTTGTTSQAVDFLNDEDYLRVHLPGYMKRLNRIFDKNCHCCTQDRLDDEAAQYESIYFTNDSLQEAKKAATSLCMLVQQVTSDNLHNGFAIIRPPGHHATPYQAGGYCILNNVAVATAFAQAKCAAKRILIIDWDVHHGNGTQSIFESDPTVLYISVHRMFYPYGGGSSPTCVGKGQGRGRNVNIGWTTKCMGDDEYLAVWERLVLPMAREFQPQLILISAGFDAAQGDVGECCVTPECYGRLTQSLMTLKVPIVAALEGGYVRSVLGKCVTQVVTALLDRDSPQKSIQQDERDRIERGKDVDILDSISPVAAKNIRATIQAHEPFWECLRK
ncbi:Histone deacetylase 10 [Seminavis robusta]|uniref:histone deacetylase n=1 Tax=Seminavis robusta TaxID=568900 RepID=A0A9N8DCD2_9STRA|nr:Histone deacetylase 10 [Seminavis robusta]|eukprot:Sro55_g032410.1 Histone deacetylase 10 (483) ;mRNA; r:107261-108709